MFAGKPSSGAAKACVNFVQDEQCVMLVAKLAQQRQERRGWYAHAASALHRFD